MMLRRMQDPSFLTRDWFVNQTSGFSVRYYFLQSINILSNFADIQVIYWVLFLVFGSLTVLGVYFIAEFLFRDYLVSYLTVLLVLFGQATSLGSTWIIDPFLVPFTVANTLVVWAILLFLKNRYVLGFSLVGLATFFHVQIGLDIALILGLYLLINSFRTNDYLTMFKALAAYLIFAVWNLIPSFTTLSSGVSGRDIVMILGNIRTPWHFIPFQFSFESYLLTGSVVLLFILSWRLKPLKDLHRFVVYLWLSLVTFCVVYTVAVEYFFLSSVIKLQVFRLTPFLIIFAYIYGFNYILQSIRTKPSVTDLILSALIFLSLLTTNPYIAILCLLAFVTYRSLVDRRFWLLAFSLLTLAVFLIFWGHSVTSFVVQFHWKMLAVLLLGGIAISFLAAKILKGPGLVLLVVFAVSLFGLLPIVVSGPRNYGIDPVRQETYRWITAKTPTDSLLITPPYFEDFRMGTQRATVIDFKTFPFRELDMVEWQRRIADLTNNTAFKFRGDRWQEITVGFKSLTQSDFERLRDKYNADYLLVENSSEALNFQIAFRNFGYVVYKLAR